MNRSEIESTFGDSIAKYRDFAKERPEQMFFIGVLCGAVLVLTKAVVLPLAFVVAALIGVFWFLDDTPREKQVLEKTATSSTLSSPSVESESSQELKLKETKAPLIEDEFDRIYKPSKPVVKKARVTKKPSAKKAVKPAAKKKAATSSSRTTKSAAKAKPKPKAKPKAKKTAKKTAAKKKTTKTSRKPSK